MAGSVFVVYYNDYRVAKILKVFGKKESAQKYIDTHPDYLQRHMKIETKRICK